MHPINDSEYGIYMADINDPIPLNIDITGLMAMWGSRILGEVWEDEYTGYSYEEGDEDVVDVLLLVDEDGYEGEFFMYLDDDDTDGE